MLQSSEGPELLTLSRGPSAELLTEVGFPEG